MNYSLKSRRKVLLSLALIIISVLFLFQTVLSFILSNLKGEITNQLVIKLGRPISFNNISFGILKGIHIKGLVILDRSDSDVPYILSEHILIKSRLLPLVFRRVVIKKIELHNSKLFIRSRQNLDYDFSDLFNIFPTDLPHQEKKKEMNIIITNLKAYIRNGEIVFDKQEGFVQGLWSIILNGEFNVYNQKNIKSKGNALITRHYPSNSLVGLLFSNHIFAQEMNYNLEAQAMKDNLYVNNLLLDIKYDRIIGKGMIRKYKTKKPILNFALTSSNFSLQNLTSFKKDFKIKGPMAISSIFKGGLTDMQFLIRLSFLGCNIKYINTPFYIDDLRGKFELTNERAKLENAVCLINNFPFDINMDYRALDSPNISLKIFSKPRKFQLPEIFKELSYFEVLFNGDRKGNKLLGDLELNGSFLKKGSLYNFDDISLSLDDLSISFLDYGETPKNKDSASLRYSIAKAILKKMSKRIDFQDVKILEFKDLIGILSLFDNHLWLKDFKLSGYGGNLKGVIDLSLSAFPFHCRIDLKANNIDVFKLYESIFGASRFKGKLSGRVVVDSYKEEFLKSSVTIRDGFIDRTEVLLALSEYMKFPKIQTIKFDNLYLNFLMHKTGSNNCNLKLYNSELILRTKLALNNDIKGELSVGIFEGLLKESQQFRRLLKYVTPQSPYIDFKFQMAGLLNSPRFIWMRDEFKEAIERVLPQGSKKSLEEGLNTMIDDLF